MSFLFHVWEIPVFLISFYSTCSYKKIFSDTLWDFCNKSTPTKRWNRQADRLLLGHLAGFDRLSRWEKHAPLRYRDVCIQQQIESEIESVLQTALKKGGDSFFLLPRLSKCYCERGPLAAQLDRWESVMMCMFSWRFRGFFRYMTSVVLAYNHIVFFRYMKNIVCAYNWFGGLSLYDKHVVGFQLRGYLSLHEEL